MRPRNSPLMFVIAIVLGFSIISSNANGENTPKRTVTKGSWRNSGMTTTGNFAPKGIIQHPGFLGPGQMRPDDAIAQVSFSWTRCEMRRSALDDEQLEIYLDGTISSTRPVHWSLSSVSPERGRLPKLYFVEAASARPRPEDADISLEWEISLNGGPFSQMTIQPDNSLSVTFPSGSHSFKVRITGAPQHQQAEGYYQLVLSQSLIPSL